MIRGMSINNLNPNGRASTKNWLRPALFALCLWFAALAAPAAGPSSISAALQPFVESHSLAGAVTSVASKDKVLDLSAVGYADVAAKKPMETGDLFWIASMSKAMTATALMMLVDEGRLKVEDPVEKYLPEFRGQMLAVEQDNAHTLLKPPRHPITVKNILTHTSGLPFKSRVEGAALDTLPLPQAVMTYALTPLQFEPDTKYSYSTAGINTAGRLIEVLSGKPYEQFMDKRLFQPLGMKNTTFWPTAKQVRRLAKSYKPDAAKTGLEEITIEQLTYPLSDRSHRYPMPAGGLFSTAEDVGRFCQMLLHGGECAGQRILSEAAVKQMTSKETGELVETSYGFGLGIANSPGGGYGHGGAYNTDMWVYPDRQIITVFMVQHAGFPGNGAKSRDAFKEAALAAFGK
jgi:CubicO group peptidase (beta-lactamase class C family)